MMLYTYYEMQRLALEPMRAMVNGALSLLDLPENPMAQTPLGRVATAALDSFEHTTRRFGKPAFGHTETIIDGQPVTLVLDERRYVRTTLRLWVVVLGANLVGAALLALSAKASASLSVSSDASVFATFWNADSTVCLYWATAAS